VSVALILASQTADDGFRGTQVAWIGTIASRGRLGHHEEDDHDDVHAEHRTDGRPSRARPASNRTPVGRVEPHRHDGQQDVQDLTNVSVVRERVAVCRVVRGKRRRQRTFSTFSGSPHAGRGRSFPSMRLSAKRHGKERR
jgi:hypothetical protein